MSQARLKENILVVNIFYDLGVGAVSVGMWLHSGWGCTRATHF